MLRRDHWLRRLEALDPETDYEEIYRLTVTLEFPWDMDQALSFALFRTFAVPAIGRLLHETGEFERRTQKRHDDTALLLDEISLHGLHSPGGRTAIRRINQMHGAYAIGNDDLRYVLATFVVMPKRWLDEHGWRAMTPREVTASVHYYRELGRLMGIKDIPGSYAEFETLLDGYEATRFGFDPGARRVADATLRLLVGFHPRLLARPVEAASRALMDEPLRAAFRYDAPPRWVESAVRAGLRLRARVERRLPARRRPLHVRDTRRIRSYPGGFDAGQLGTFPRGCPASARRTARPVVSAARPARR